MYSVLQSLLPEAPRREMVQRLSETSMPYLPTCSRFAYCCSITGQGWRKTEWHRSSFAAVTNDTEKLPQKLPQAQESRVRASVQVLALQAQRLLGGRRFLCLCHSFIHITHCLCPPLSSELTGGLGLPLRHSDYLSTFFFHLPQDLGL